MAVQRLDNLCVHKLGIDIIHCPNNLIKQYVTKLDWVSISNRELDISFIREFKDYIMWEYISQKEICLYLQFFGKISSLDLGKIYVKNFEGKQELTLEFITEFKDYINWNYISKRKVGNTGGVYLDNKNISENFIRDFKDYINWNIISEKKDLSLEFITEFKDYINGHIISRTHTLNREKIEILKDKLDWKYISETAHMTERFMRDYKDYLDWFYISYKYRPLSKKFVEEHKDYIKEDAFRFFKRDYFTILNWKFCRLN